MGVHNTVKLVDADVLNTDELADVGVQDTVELADAGVQDTVELADVSLQDTVELADVGVHDSFALADLWDIPATLPKLTHFHSMTSNKFVQKLQIARYSWFVKKYPPFYYK